MISIRQICTVLIRCVTVKSQKTVVRRASKISNYARRSHERGFVNLAKVGFLYLRVLVMRVSQKGGFLAH